MNACAVVGGGMLGMTLALQLSRAGYAVTLYEASPEPGGLTSGFSYGPASWDCAYHVVLPRDRALRSLLSDLQLENQIGWHPATSAFFAQGRMHPFTTPLDQLRFPVISLADKVRLWQMVQRTMRRTDWRVLSHERLEPWLRRECGDRVFERIWRPLLRAKLGDAYHETAASFIWATIVRLYGKGFGEAPARFGFLRCGYRGVIERLLQRLHERRVQLRCGAPVTCVDNAAYGTLAVHTAADTRVFDRVVMTVPAPLAARIAVALSDEERDRLKAIRYQGVVCASLLMDRPLGNAYITNIADDTIPFTAVIEMSALCGTEPFGGRHLAYLPRYCTPGDRWFSAGDAAIRSDALDALARMYPRFTASSVRAFRLMRAPAVFALPTVDYFGRVPGFLTSRRGLYLAMSAQIENATLNVDETVALASRAALHITTDSRFLLGGVRETAG